MNRKNSNIDIEKKTISKMIEMYCKSKHKTKSELCADCRELYDYSMLKLNKCVFGEDKPVCSKCTIHCYKADKRGQIKKLMRFSGFRMIFKHPVLAIHHLIKMFKSNNR